MTTTGMLPTTFGTGTAQCKKGCKHFHSSAGGQYCTLTGGFLGQYEMGCPKFEKPEAPKQSTLGGF